MERSWEEEIYRVKENLETYSVMIQENANKALKTDSNRVFHYRRGEISRNIDEVQDLYLKCRELDSLARTLKVDEEEQRDEEVRLYLEKHYSNLSENSLEGDIGKALSQHIENEEKAKISELLAHGNSTHALRHTIHQYERLLHNIDQKFEEIEVKAPYSPEEDDGEIIEETSGEKLDEPVDLTEEFFLKTVI